MDVKLCEEYKVCYSGLPCGSESKEFACNAGDLSLIPGSGRSPGGGHGNLSGILAWRILDRGALWVTVQAAAKSQTRLSNEHFYF